MVTNPKTSLKAEKFSNWTLLLVMQNSLIKWYYKMSMCWGLGEFLLFPSVENIFPISMSKEPGGNSLVFDYSRQKRGWGWIAVSCFVLSMSHSCVLTSPNAEERTFLLGGATRPCTPTLLQLPASENSAENRDANGERRFLFLHPSPTWDGPAAAACLLLQFQWQK